MATRIRGSLQRQRATGDTLSDPITSAPLSAEYLPHRRQEPHAGSRASSAGVLDRTSLPPPHGGSIVVGDRKPRLYGVCHVYTLTLLSGIGGFLFGYDTGITSASMLLLVADFQFTPHEQSLIVSTTLIGCIVAAIGAIFFTECFGRRRTIQLSSLVFVAGAVTMAKATGLHTLLAGRFVVGLAIGVASVVVPMYIAEVAPSAQRGSLVALNHVFVTGGHFTACVVAAVCTHVDFPHRWRWMFGLAAIPAFVQLIGFLCLPESPRWLAKYKGKDSAVRVLRQLRGADDVSVEVAGILASIDEHSHLESSNLGCCAAVQGAPVRRAMTLGCMLHLVQQFTGINTVMYYCGTIFVMAGFKEPSVAIWLTAGVSFVGMLSCCLGVVAVDRLGRRKLTLISLATVVLALLTIGVGFFWLEQASGSAIQHPSGTNRTHESGWASTQTCAHHRTCIDCVADSSCGFCTVSNATSGRVDASGYCVPGNASGPAAGLALVFCQSLANDHGLADMTHESTGNRSFHFRSSRDDGGAFDWRFWACFDGSGFQDNVGGKIVFVATMIYLATFQPGMGAMPWTLNSEIYPLHARSLGMCVSTIAHWIANLLVSYTFLPWVDMVGTPVAFLSYATFGLLGWGWLMWSLPETRGLNLEELEEVFTRYADRVAKEYARRDPSSLDVHKYVRVK